MYKPNSLTGLIANPLTLTLTLTLYTLIDVVVRMDLHSAHPSTWLQSLAAGSPVCAELAHIMRETARVTGKTACRRGRFPTVYGGGVEH